MRLPLAIRLSRSRSAAAALTVIHGLAVAAIAVSQFSPGIKIPLLLLVAFSMAQGLRTHALHEGGSAVVAIILREGSELELEYANGRRIATRVDPSSTVLHWLMALRLGADNKRLSLWLLPDMLDAGSWRSLSVFLRAIAADTT
jgi:Membrane-bound toxin component of toxin-antitoxin system